MTTGSRSFAPAEEGGSRVVFGVSNSLRARCFFLKPEPPSARGFLSLSAGQLRTLYYQPNTCAGILGYIYDFGGMV